MNFGTEFWFHPFALGLYLGLVFTVFALLRGFRLAGELKRYKRHLSEKLELEGDAVKRLRAEQETLRKENENLRVKVAALNEQPDRRAHRDLEVFARAEKRMMLNAPGFAPAWESAKTSALGELESEEAGQSLPRRLFGKVFATSRVEEKPALPAGAENRTVASQSAPLQS